ncbi:MAG: NAD(P)/FAD-dependent oxidoreductase [Candidatus Eremiobacteraeota bacterium]|nr:NAD(P)/FAD-dependent oxidoreductase [Candidatus Eremiobacteraeota bacterium]
MTQSTGSRGREGRRYDVLLIGSGLASLTAAALLAESGRKVCLLEACEVAGGSVDSLPMGVSVWGCAPGEKFHSFLKKLDLQDEILFDPLESDGYDHVILPDRRRVKIPYGFDQLADNIEAAYPGQGPAVRRFTAILDRLTREVAQLPHKMGWWQALTQGYKFTTLLRYHRATLQQVLDECRVSPEAQAVLVANSGNYMGSPDELSILAYNGLFSGYNRGAYYPRKPFRHMTDRLVEFITSRAGCHIYYHSEVTQVQTSGEYVDQVVTRDGRRFTAPTLICNGDPRKMMETIGRHKFPYSYLQPLQDDCSLTAVTCYLGIGGIDLRDYGFGRHNTWHLEQWDMNRTWDEAMGGDWSRPWMYMATPTLQTDEPGTQMLELATAANYDFFYGLKQLNAGDYRRKKMEVENRLIDLVEAHYVPNLRKHIKLHLTGSPSTREARGPAYGRLKSRTPWQNFFWCSATNGYPGVNGTVGTGMQLYMELTGDHFWNPAQAPESNSLAGSLRQISLSTA